MEKLGLVLEGGGMRGVYTTGVLDFLMEQNIYTDGVIGVMHQNKLEELIVLILLI